ncbi:MAG: hypothetical protein H6742_09610 [Alphaproteobacteria bacterium]|nr:hypothetical protein [Alphaproteobacteria bacterium]
MNRVSLPDLSVLQCAGARFDLHAVLCAAELRGDLGPWIDALERQVAAARRVDNRTLQGALTAFRKARGLTAADDFKAWMAARGLSLDAVADHLERALAPPGDARADAGACAYAELVCTGTLDRWTRELAQLLAVWAEHGAPVSPQPPPPPVAGLAPDQWARLHAAWALFQDRAASLLDDAALRRLLETRTLDLVRFELEALPAADEDVARELLLCLRVDGMAPADAAALARVPLQALDRFARDLDPAMRRELLAGVPGQVLGPFASGGAHVVLRVVGKRLPSLSDPRVRELLADQARDAAFGALVRRHVAPAG